MSNFNVLDFECNLWADPSHRSPCDFTLSDLSGSITGTPGGGPRYILIRGASPSAKDPLTRAIATFVASRIGQAASCMALSLGELVPSHRSEVTYQVPSQAAFPAASSGWLRQWLQMGEATQSVPIIRFVDERPLRPIDPPLVPLTGRLLKMWQPEQ